MKNIAFRFTNSVFFFMNNKDIIKTYFYFKLIINQLKHNNYFLFNFFINPLFASKDKNRIFKCLLHKLDIKKRFSNVLLYILKKKYFKNIFNFFLKYKEKIQESLNQKKISIFFNKNVVGIKNINNIKILVKNLFKKKCALLFFNKKELINGYQIKIKNLVISDSVQKKIKLIENLLLTKIH